MPHLLGLDAAIDAGQAWRLLRGEDQRGRKVRWLLGLLRPYRGRVILMFISLVIATGAALAEATGAPTSRASASIAAISRGGRCTADPFQTSRRPAPSISTSPRRIDVGVVMSFAVDGATGPSVTK